MLDCFIVRRSLNGPRAGEVILAYAGRTTFELQRFASACRMDDIQQYYEINREMDEIIDININYNIPKRYIRNMENPFEFYNDAEFKRRYRFSKHIAANIILPIISDQFTRNNRRGLPFPSHLCLLVALRFYSTGNFQVVSGDLQGFSQSSISRCIKKVSMTIAQQLPVYIKFPADEQSKRRNSELFQNIANFPHVTGCIDCTHIKIKSPGGDMAEVYRNRKQFFSMNVQVVAGPNLEIFDIVAQWPGSEHDSMIFDRSSVKVRFDNGELEGYLLGDSAYPCLPFLMTPLHQTNSEADARYNQAHICTRNIVENLFNDWKKRFPCLSRGIGNKLETVPDIIVACAVLYNIGIRFNDLFDYDEEIEPEIVGSNLPDNAVQNGQAIRRMLIQTHFN